jgi:DNA-binding XRE family transcriptional regulator
MIVENEKYLQNMAAVVRGARKYFGMGQVDLSLALEISQSKISKFEAGLQMCTATFWFKFCKYFGIHPQFSYEYGLIDQIGHSEHTKLLKVANLNSDDSTLQVYVRVVRPLIQLAYTQGHGKKLDAFLANYIDPDYFVVLGQKVSSQFELRLYETLNEWGLIDKRWEKKMIGPSQNGFFHGEFEELYQANTGFKKCLMLFSKNWKSYDGNWSIKIDQIDLSKTRATWRANQGMEGFVKDQKIAQVYEKRHNSLLHSFQAYSDSPIQIKLNQNLENRCQHSFEINHA